MKINNTTKIARNYLEWTNSIFIIAPKFIRKSISFSMIITFRTTWNQYFQMSQLIINVHLYQKFGIRYMDSTFGESSWFNLPTCIYHVLVQIVPLPLVWIDGSVDDPWNVYHEHRILRRWLIDHRRILTEMDHSW